MIETHAFISGCLLDGQSDMLVCKINRIFDLLNSRYGCYRSSLRQSSSKLYPLGIGGAFSHVFGKKSAWAFSNFDARAFFRSFQAPCDLSGLEFFCVTAMCSLLCGGPVFDTVALADDNSWGYSWLNLLLMCENEKVCFTQGGLLIGGSVICNIALG